MIVSFSHVANDRLREFLYTGEGSVDWALGYSTLAQENDEADTDVAFEVADRRRGWLAKAEALHESGDEFGARAALRSMWAE